MTVATSPNGSPFFGDLTRLSVDRALRELQARRPIRVSSGDTDWLVLPVEGLDDRRLHAFSQMCSPGSLVLAITAQRALALGLDTTMPMAITLSTATTAKEVCALATSAASRCSQADPAVPAAASAVHLVKLSGALPAALVARDTSCDDVAASIAGVAAEAIALFANADESLTFASDADVPLATGGTARFVVFRDAFGVEQTAIIVGRLDVSQPVPVRMHSACLTGDVFGSRRCDCGDQLRLALERLQDLGGGIILYLAQEGRGIGLVNKMRAYRLQDAGLDTRDANTTLGFCDDERDYDCAALMLHALDCKRIKLLTNNPAKLDGLSTAGIEVIARIPLEAPVTDQNRRYLKAKALRSGHTLFGIHSPAT